MKGFVQNIEDIAIKNDEFCRVRQWDREKSVRTLA